MRFSLNAFVSYMQCTAKILILNEEGIMKKIFYEHRAYESVDDRSLSNAISRNLTGKRFQAVMG